MNYLSVVVNPNLKPLKHGREMEPEAKQAYIAAQSRHHRSFKAENCGIFIDLAKPYLAASPDMLVNCECCGHGTLEVKCPLQRPCVKCNPSICECPENCLKYMHVKNGCLCLKPNHAYYAQIQGQMFISNRTYCDFFIYEKHATFMQRILKDELFWSKLVPSLDFFFINYIVPKLITKSCELECEVEPMEVDVVPEGNVYFCPICREKVKESECIRSFGERSIACEMCDSWFHFKCVKITKSVLETIEDYVCPSCSLL